MAEQPRATPERREKWLTAFGLAGVSLSFAAFSSQYVSRVTNNLWGDIAFSGWSAAIGHRLAMGEQIYRDFAIPLPPGSFVVLAWLEKISGWGGPSMLLECLTCATCHLFMGLLGYLIARPLVGRLNALLTCAGALGWICGWPKELAYDHLAQVCAWAGIGILVLAWVSDNVERARRLLFCAGLSAGTTLLFKQSTAIGSFAAGLIGIGYLALVDRHEPGALVARLKGMLVYAAGALAGFAFSIGAACLAGGTVAGFLRAIFVDGPALKGGAGVLAARTLFGAIGEPFIVFSLFGSVLLVALGFRIAARAGGFVIGGVSTGTFDAEAQKKSSLGGRHVAGTVVLVAFAFGIGAVMLAARAKSVPAIFSVLALFSSLVVQMGSCLAVAFFFGNARSTAVERPARAYNAAALAALSLSAFVSMSLMNFRPLEENNATIVIALMAVFSGLERARLGGLRWLALAFMLSAPLGSKLPRALLANNTVQDSGFFRGMLVNSDGLEVVRAAARARSLAGEDGTVLVLPEDPSLAALIGGARPDLCGAIVFADQYPDRCLERDLSYLGKHLPRVIVTHPTAPDDWRPAFRQWRSEVPAELLTTRFLALYAKRYDRDSSYATRWAERTAALDVWVLRQF